MYSKEEIEEALTVYARLGFTRKTAELGGHQAPAGGERGAGDGAGPHARGSGNRKEDPVADRARAFSGAGSGAVYRGARMAATVPLSSAHSPRHALGDLDETALSA